MPSPVLASESACPPVLILAFNRPSLTRRVIDALRPVAPARVFFSVDGPRKDVTGEQALVAEVQSLTADIDWPCETKVLFRTDNRGCKLGVSEAISWFFEDVDAGVILEDDCIPERSFFRFAAELLRKYADEERVLLISGDNFHPQPDESSSSYQFSIYPHIWGWATWRRAWRHYDHSMKAWPELRKKRWLKNLLSDKRAEKYWSGIFDATYSDRNNSWAYRWAFSCWSKGGLTILPRVNLVSNIGFGAEATHTKGTGNPFAFLPTHEMPFPLAHPRTIERDIRADRIIQRIMFTHPSLVQRISRRLEALIRPAS